MQKIKTTVIKQWFAKKMTSAEVNFLIYISHYQNDLGFAIGIYYKDVCEALAMSVQTFYNIMDSLQKKEIISVKRMSDIDYDVCIIGNTFEDRSYKEGYINTNKKIFYSREFLSLKAPEKLMLIDLMRNTYCNSGRYVIGKENFYQKYMEMFNVGKRIVMRYLGKMRKYFYVCLKNGNYIFVMKKGHFDKTKQTEADVYASNVVRTGCRRQRIKQVSEKVIKDTATVMIQYREYIAGITETVLNAIGESIRVINMYNAPKDPLVRELRPKLVHKLVRKNIGRRVQPEF